MSTRSLFHSLSLSALLAVSGLPALSQETAPADDLSLGTAANAAPAVLTAETAQVGQGYLAATFEQWEQRC